LASDAAAFEEQATTANNAYKNREKDWLEGQATVTRLTQQWQQAQEARAKAETLLEAERLTSKGYEAVITSGAKRNSEFYAATAKLKELGLEYDPRTGWNRAAHRQPTPAELALAKHLFKNLDQ
jgi:hypothetical protein